MHKNQHSDQVPKSYQVQYGHITQPLNPHFPNSLVNLLLISLLWNKTFRTSPLKTGGLVGGDRLSLLEKQHTRLHTIERLVRLLKHLSLKRSIIWPLIEDSALDCFHLFVFATRPIAQWGRMSSLCLPVSGAVLRMETLKWPTLWVKLKPIFWYRNFCQS